MKVFPNAKINLGLHVVGKRQDGFHNLETIFYPLPLCDSLEVKESKKTKLSFDGTKIAGDPEKNLVMKAFRLLQQDFKLPELSIILSKKIPTGAGLGGGSSDGAFMLKLLNEQFSLDISDQQLERYAAQLGADCPFFIRNAPVLAKGIGNEFESIDLSLKGHYLVLIKPSVEVSTAEAYGEIVPQDPKFDLMDLGSLPLEIWRDNLVNDFEKSVFPLHTEIEAIKEDLYANGAVYACMSGSGSSVFGLFEKKANCNFKKRHPKAFVWMTQL